MDKKALVVLITSVMILSVLPVLSVNAATDDEIEDAIADGITFLISKQSGDGSWANHPAYTGLVLIKLQDRAYELDYDSPFDPAYPYQSNVIDAWEYLLNSASTTSIPVQTAGDPDANGNGIGIHWGNYVYSTGICLMALVASGTPSRVNELNIDFDSSGNPDTYKEIAQDVAEWLAYAQTDSGYGQGGWNYNAMNNQGPRSDNSISGYAVLGLAAAEATTARPGATAFACTIPGFVKSELNIWINYIQCTTPGGNYGGSGYHQPCYWVNELKTGNLLFEMRFYGDSQGVTRFDDALDYIENHWQDTNTNPGWGYNSYPAHYQAMYCLMKGLNYSGIDLIDTDGDSVRDDSWYNQEPPASPPQDFASVLVQQQNADGSWPKDVYSDSGRILSTAWALLTLEAVSPPPPVIYPTDDSYTDQRIPYRNYGTATTLWAYHKPYPIDRYTWLKFDISGVSTVDSATLHLHTHSSYGSPRTCDRIFGVHFSNDDSWDETTITWWNQPLFNAGAEDTVTNPVRCTPVEFDVTSIVQSEAAAGEDFISFVIKSEENCYMDWLCMYSKEHPNDDYRPYLEID